MSTTINATIDANTVVATPTTSFWDTIKGFWSDVVNMPVGKATTKVADAIENTSKPAVVAIHTYAKAHPYTTIASSPLQFHRRLVNDAYDQVFGESANQDTVTKL